MCTSARVLYEPGSRRSPIYALCKSFDSLKRSCLSSTSVRSTGSDENIAVYQTQDFQREQRGYRYPNEPQPSPKNSSCPRPDPRKNATLPFPIQGAHRLETGFEATVCGNLTHCDGRLTGDLDFSRKRRLVAGWLGPKQPTGTLLLVRNRRSSRGRQHPRMLSKHFVKYFVTLSTGQSSRSTTRKRTTLKSSTRTTSHLSSQFVRRTRSQSISFHSPSFLCSPNAWRRPPRTLQTGLHGAPGGYR